MSADSRKPPSTGRHHHGHSHSPAAAGDAGSAVSDAAPIRERTRRAFAIGVILNVAFAIVEWGAGWWSGSLALIADAGHNLSDVLGLLLAWAALTLARTLPSARFTYGLRSSSILSAFANGVLLLFAAGAIAWEAVRRLAQPHGTVAEVVVVVALVAVAVNALTAWLLHRGQQHDLNVRGAYLHMLADAGVSGAVVAGGAALWATGLEWIDPVLSLLVVGVIVVSTWGLLRESLRLALHAVPTGVDIDAIRRYLESLPGVVATHDLHVWGMSTTETALSVHLVLPGGHPGDRFLAEIAAELERRHGVCHATMQIEVGDSDDACALEPDHVV